MKRTTFFLAVGLFIAITSLQVYGLEGKKIQIELFGGYTTLNPNDLNKRAEFDQLYEAFFTEDQYNYYDRVFGDNYESIGWVVGEFKKIKKALPAGFRLKYSVSDRISLSLGFQYLARIQESEVFHLFDVRSLNPDRVFFSDDFINRIDHKPYSLRVQGYIPMVGIHYKLTETLPFGLEGYVTAGPFLARCRISHERNARKQNSLGYWIEDNEIYEIEGKGTGIAVDTGIQINIELIKNTGLFIEGGYSYRRAGNITGKGSSITTRKDQNSAGYTQESEWEGQWVNVQGSSDRAWGNINFTFPSNEYGTDNFSDFYLDLSGFQIKIGFSLKL